MKIKSFLFLAAAFLLCTNCFAVQTKVNRGPIHARTFNFVNRSSKPTPGFVDNTDAAHAMIQKAITKRPRSDGPRSDGPRSDGRERGGSAPFDAVQ